MEKENSQFSEIKTNSRCDSCQNPIKNDILKDLKGKRHIITKTE